MKESEKIYGQKVISCYYAQWGDLGEKGSDAYWISGYATVYENGYKTVCGGGSASSVDFHSLTLLDENNKIVGTYEEKV